MCKNDFVNPSTGISSAKQSLSRRGPVIGIAGGSGSGKSTLVKALLESADCNVVVLPQDLYYRDLSHLPLDERRRVNFDRPNALDFDLMAFHIDELASGRSIRAPIYDFHEHVRKGERCLPPGNLLVVEGTLVLSVEEIASRLDWRVFVETPSELRLARRIERDRMERGRSPEATRRQYEETVLPMYESWIAPIKETADLTVDGSLLKHEMIVRFQKDLLLFLQSRNV